MRYIKLAVGYGVLVVKADMPVQTRRGYNGVIKPIAEAVARPLEFYCCVGGFFVRPNINIKRGEVAALEVNNVNAADYRKKRRRVFMGASS